MSPLLFILIAAILLTIISGFYVFIMGCLGRKQINWLDKKQAGKTPWGKYYPVILDSHRFLQENHAQDVYITSYDGLRLHGLWIPVENAKGTVLMAHGYRSTMLVDCHLAFELFHRLGWNILAPEQRSHGQSQGRFITFGVKESRDMETWIQYHNTHFGDIPVLLFGISMGASTMLYLADRDLSANVRGIIADCGFTSASEIIRSVFQRVIHLPALPSVWIAGFFARVIAGFSFWECDTRKSLKNSRLPVLLIHGKEDGFVPYEMTMEGYDACTGPRYLLLVEGAEHGMSYVTDGLGYTTAVMDFLKKYTEKG